MKNGLTETADRVFRVSPDPDLDAAFAAIRKELEKATVDVAAALGRIKVENALIGGIAAGAYSTDPMNTTNADFIVTSRHRDLVNRDTWTLKMGLPPSARNVRIHVMAPKKEDASHLDRAIRSSKTSRGVRVIPVEALFFLKLDGMEDPA